MGSIPTARAILRITIMRIPFRRSEKGARSTFDPHLTQVAYDKLKAKLEHLKKVTRLRLMEEVATLAAGGDFSENTAYQIAKGRLRAVNAMILELETRLRQAIVIKKPSSLEIVGLGSSVTIEVDGKRKQYMILGSSEVDPAQNIISHNSPLGVAVMGKKVGETITFVRGGKSVVATIIEII